ncbi:Transposase DDE domain protein [Roseimaritima multifibrata]|uniref:Transposase DDE domain protein n=1 Tax=Roseimaritima multifibrata TaxID=1930274 RepID=A0A517MGX8_9BACT|nr:transposase [Roseimaritima multifibrata]QDS94131.1 Transposase DDE domain protein [Roseimaritima multifibrata]QDS96656.1 Transposase DDE domain protein [Roseimaritima multifibrata]
MNVDELLERFKKDCPVALGTRLVLNHLLSNERMDALFARHVERQRCGELLFSSVADVMACVALKIKPSVNAAYRRHKENIEVSIASVYNKLQGIELQVSRALVSETAAELSQLWDHLEGPKSLPVFNGYATRIMDGNHLAGTEHRIKELRTLGAAALPATTIPILDPDKKLLVDVIVCRDGHAGEATLHPQIFDLVQKDQVWIGDRHFASQKMMTTIALDKQAFFVLRHSTALLPNWESQGKRSKIGPCDGGVLYEQKISFTYQGRPLHLRRITIELDKPTRKGDKAVHILTNLPKRVSAKKVAKGYRKRWNIETAFQQLATTLHSEIKTLGYPKAALFSFCMAVMMYNILSVIKTSIGCAANDADLADKVSSYYAANDVSESWKGFAIAVTEEEFDSVYRELTLEQLAKELVDIGKQLDFSRYKKSPRGPKKPPPKKKSGNRGNHVSTAKILDQRAAKC